MLQIISLSLLFRATCLSLCEVEPLSTKSRPDSRVFALLGSLSPLCLFYLPLSPLIRTMLSLRTTWISFTIIRKSLVGHPKCSATTWQMAGLLQPGPIENRAVPGNGNANDTDVLFPRHSLMFPSKSIQTDGISGGIMACSDQLCSGIEVFDYHTL